SKFHEDVLVSNTNTDTKSSAERKVKGIFDNLDLDKLGQKSIESDRSTNSRTSKATRSEKVDRNTQGYSREISFREENEEDTVLYGPKVPTTTAASSSKDNTS